MFGNRQVVKLAATLFSLLILFAALPLTALAGPRESYPYWQWGPDWGKADVYWNYDINRPYAWMEPYWTSWERLTAMQRSSLYVNAYEHEIYFYNYCDGWGGCAYATGAEGYWTDLPGQTYYDPQVDNSYDKPVVEIGTADADQLQAYYYYTIDAVLVPHSDWSRSKIRQVRGYRTIGCWGWECVWEVDGQIVVPYNNYAVPGYIHWHY